jgi:hypothetical protein
MSRKIRFECLPPALWGKNIRSELGQQQWDISRKKAYKRHNHKCCMCGCAGKMNAHEVWKLSISKKNNYGIQKLIDIISVCDDCHNVIHIGRSLAIGIPFDVLIQRYMNLNQINYQEAIEDFNYIDKKLITLNQITKWSIDLSDLNKIEGGIN